MSIIFKKFQRDLYSELPKIAVSIIIISMGIGGFITFFQVSDNIKETVDSQYEEMNLGDSWINLQPIPIPTPDELIEYSKQNDDSSINEILPKIDVMQPRLHRYGNSEGKNGPIIIEILGLPDEQKINKLRMLNFFLILIIQTLNPKKDYHANNHFKGCKLLMMEK